MARQHLIFDADDTLWENNVLFERTVDDFIAWLDHPTGDPGVVRQVLQDIEAANSATHGYGSKVFLRSLRECFEQVRDAAATDDDVAYIDRLAHRLREGYAELIPDVERTLNVLGQRHDLLLLTKGDPAEQRRKLDASGLEDHFRAVVIVMEKTTDVYTQMIIGEGLLPERTWMIGNSVRSDVLPALAAGIGAVFVPNANTWALEDAPLPENAERLASIERFPDLLTLF